MVYRLPPDFVINLEENQKQSLEGFCMCYGAATDVRSRNVYTVHIIVSAWIGKPESAGPRQQVYMYVV